MPIRRTVLALLFSTTVALYAQAPQWETEYHAGVAANLQGRFAEARQFFEAAMSSAGSDPFDLRYGDLATLLAGVYQVLGESEKADRLFASVQAMLDSNPNVNGPLGVLLLHGVGSHLATRGRFQEAEPYLLRALRMSVEASGERGSQTAAVQATQAKAYMHQGRFSEARPLLENAVAVHRETLPASDLDRIASELALGVLNAQEQRFVDARALLQSAREGAMQLGDRHPTVADTFIRLAEVYRRTGDSAHGEPLLRQALAIYERSAGPETHRVADALIMIGTYHLDAGRPALAEQQIRRALAIFRKVNGPDHAATGVAEYRLAQALAHQKRPAEAKPLVKHALQIEERSSPNGSNLVAECLYGLAELAVLERNRAEAEGYYRKAITAYERSVGPTNPAMAPITSAVRGVPSEVILSEEDGMKAPCAVNLHNAITVSQDRLGKRVARLGLGRMTQICGALRFSLGCDPSH